MSDLREGYIGIYQPVEPVPTGGEYQQGSGKWQTQSNLGGIVNIQFHFHLCDVAFLEPSIR